MLPTSRMNTTLLLSGQKQEEEKMYLLLIFFLSTKDISSLVSCFEPSHDQGTLCPECKIPMQEMVCLFFSLTILKFS